MTDEIIIGGDSADIPDSTYPAVCTGWEVKHSDKFDNDFRVWHFTLDGTESKVDGSSSMATSSKSKGGQWIANLLGRKPEKGESVTVVGRPCLVVVSSARTEWPEVTSVLPPMAAGKPTSQRKAPSTEDDAKVGAEPTELPF